jgi:hypothetical protein
MTMTTTKEPVSKVQQVWQQAARKAADAGGMDPATFTALLRGVYRTRYGKDLDDVSVSVWYFTLRRLTMEQFLTGVDRYNYERSKEQLTPQLIIELSGAVETRENAALEAWQEAIDAVRIVGSYRSPAFSNPTTSHVIQSLGGWDWFCDQKPEQLREWVRGRFLKTFEALAVSARTEQPVRLPNLLTKTGGEMVEMPARIGVSVERLAKRLGSDLRSGNAET